MGQAQVQHSLELLPAEVAVDAVMPVAHQRQARTEG
jgi:hypothetical protein